MRYKMFQSTKVITCPSCNSKINTSFICHNCGFFKSGTDLSFVDIIFNHHSFPLKVSVQGSFFYDLNLNSSQISKSYFPLIRLFPDSISQNYFAVIDLEFILLKKDSLILGHILNSVSSNTDCSNLIKGLINEEKSFLYQLLCGDKETLFLNNNMTEYFPLIASIYINDDKLAKDWLDFNINKRKIMLDNLKKGSFANHNAITLTKICSPVDILSSYYLLEDSPYALSIANDIYSSLFSVFLNRNLSANLDYHNYVLRLISYLGLFFNHSDNIRSLIFSFTAKDCKSFFAFFSHLYPFSNRDIKFIPNFYQCFNYEDFSENIPLFVNTICLFYPFKLDKILNEYLFLLSDSDLTKVDSPHTMRQVKDLIKTVAPAVLTSSIKEEMPPIPPPAPEVQSFSYNENIQDELTDSSTDFNLDDDTAYIMPNYLTIPDHVLKNRKKSTIPQEKYSILDKFIGFSDSVESLKANIYQFTTGTNAHIMLVGETGTGKEVVAGIIRDLLNITDEQFSAINCAALLDNILISDLFGHVKGSYTSANQDRIGFLGDKNIRLVFIDEFNSAPNQFQSALLRYLQDGSYIKMGDTTKMESSARLIFAVNQDIGELVKNGKLREDFYHRIPHIISIPPLRERKEDILLLLSFFNKDLNLSFSEKAIKFLKEYEWGGNVREFCNLIENLKTHISMQGNILITEDLVKKYLNSLTHNITTLSSLNILSGDEFKAKLFLDQIADILKVHFTNVTNVRIKDIVPHFVSSKGVKLSSHSTFSTDYLKINRPHFQKLLQVYNSKWKIISDKCPQIFK